MTRRLKAVIIVALCVALGAMPPIRTLALRTLGAVLVSDQPAKAVDVIVVPEWTEDAGAIEAADLVKQRISATVAVFVNPPNPSTRELIRRGILAPGQVWQISLLRHLGVQHVEPIVSVPNGTHAEGPFLYEWLTQHHYGSALVVSTTDHSRRLRRILDRARPPSGPTTIVHSSKYSGFDAETWWQSRAGLRTGVIELEKLLVDLVLHPL